MASFGTSHLVWSKFKTEDSAAAAPTYDVPINITGNRKCEYTPNMVTGSICGDNTKQEEVTEFVDGTLAIEATDITNAAAAAMLGATIGEDGEITHKEGDVAPYGGVGYIKHLMRGGVKYYKGYFIPKCKAVRQSDSSSTKESSITLTGASMQFTVFPLINNGHTDYESPDSFTKESEAIAWIREKFGVANSGA